MEKQNKFISIEEYLMGRATLETLSKECIENVNILIPKVNELLEVFYKDNPKEPKHTVSSGYRPADINKKVGGAKASNHMKCAAVDLHDSNGKLDEWCLKNINKLKILGLWLEHPDYTKGWTHLQCVSVKSGSNPFIP